MKIADDILRQLIDAVYEPIYSVPQFGREGLITQDPAAVIQLTDDFRPEPFGADRVHAPRDMILWMVMKRCGLSLDDARWVARDDDARVTVLTRKHVRFDGGPNDPACFAGRLILEFSYLSGLGRVSRVSEHGDVTPIER